MFSSIKLCFIFLALVYILYHTTIGLKLKAFSDNDYRHNVKIGIDGLLG